MASDEKRSAVEDCLGLFENAILWVPLDEMERERLRGEVSAARKELRALRAENARLREALEKIASETAATWVCDTARAALGGRDE